MSATDAQKRAAKKYLEKFETLRFRVPLGKGDKIKAHATRQGMSLNAYIVSLIDKDMDEGQK